MPALLRQSPSWTCLWGAIALANLPDLDFLPGLLTGEPLAFHRRGSHTLIAAVLIGFLVAVGLPWARKWAPKTLKFSAQQRLRWGTWATAIYLGHLCLDFFMADHIPPFGIQLLWPFSDAFFLSPIALIPGFQFDDLLSWHNFTVVGIEILWFVPMLWVARAIVRKPRAS